MNLKSKNVVSHQGGWTFVEMLVAVSLSAIFMGAAALVLSSINHNSKRLASLVDVDIGSIAKTNFYGPTPNGEDVDVVRPYAAPNFGQLLQAQEMRNVFVEDLNYASACFALPRSNVNTVRPEFFDFPSGTSGATAAHPQLDSPEAFRDFLAVIEPDSTGVFDTEIRNVPPTAKPSVTIFMLGALTQTDFIRVNAVYEIDLVTPTGKTGTYASVRRYKNSVLTNYYDIYYADGPGGDLYPVFVAFERQSRQLISESADIDRFKVSPGAPFYFFFFPDPAIDFKSKPAWTAVDAATSPRATYEKMAGKTSFMVVAPMFPSL